MAPASPPPHLPSTHIVDSMAVVNDDARAGRPAGRSIASLLGPSGEMPERNLLSLSRLAAEMEPVSPGDVFATRTRSGPVGRRENRDSMRLGVASGSTKRMSRTKSAFGNMRRAVQAVASAATSSSESVLRPIQPASSKATSTTNSLDSCVGATAPSVPKTEATAAAMLTNLPRLHASRLRLEHSNVFQAAAQRLAESQQQPRTPMTPNGTANTLDQRMEIETGPNREPSSSSHDLAKTSTVNAKARTTPDAKRAQNRESAKRFRVAQKKRWADLQDLVTQKDKEISRLTDMLQKVTDARQPVKPRAARPVAQADGPLDALVMAELDLFVKLVSSPGPASTGTAHTDKSRQHSLLAAPANNIGSLHRVLVATTDGSITGVRHLNSRVGAVSGGAVGQYLWDEVHESDSLQLRFTVLHAGRFADEMTKEALVFAYRRGVTRRSTDGDSRESGATSSSKDDQYIRMKGCVHPVLTAGGEVSHLMLAEFVET